MSRCNAYKRFEYCCTVLPGYLADREELTIVDIGSQDVTGSLRNVAPTQHRYIGVDFASGNGVDVVLTDPYVYPFDTGTIEII